MSVSGRLTVFVVLVGLGLAPTVQAQTKDSLGSPLPLPDDSAAVHLEPDTSALGNCLPPHGDAWPDSLDGRDAREARARWAARMDPGILMYREAPQGTYTPNLADDRAVDPDMILPPRSGDDCND